MGVNLRANGKEIKCMGLAFLPGLMDAGTKEPITETKRKDWGHSFGQTSAYTKAVGWMGNNMEQVFTHLLRINRKDKENG